MALYLDAMQARIAAMTAKTIKNIQTLLDWIRLIGVK
jgi:hypothetical protein